MQGNGGVYAVKSRRKPVQKNAKPPPVKTNPSKRHRDRLNVELERLTGLLPFTEEVRGRLDKLSVLRLSVGYLKVKSYFHATLQKNARSAPPVSANGRNGQSVSLDGVGFSEGDLLLQALHGFVLVVTTDGTVFYTSPTIQGFLGFHQSDVVHQSVFDLIHMDDREMFRCQLHFALNPSEADKDVRAGDGQSSSKAVSSSQSFLPQYIPPENSSFLERSFCCRLRCLLDNTSGFLALNFNGRLKYLHLQGTAGADGTVPQLALFAIATPVQSPSVMEIRTKTLIFQTKHRLDFAPMGIDTRGKLVLGYTEAELITTGSGYQFLHAADMMYCADNHLKMIKTGDSGFSIFRLLTKSGQWLWVQASARIVLKGGRPDFIIARQKALTNEEGEEHLHQRRQQLPFNVATGEAVLYDVSLDVFSIPGPSGPPGPPGPPGPGSPGPAAESTAEKPLDPASILGSFHRQDHSVYVQPEKPSPPLPIFSQMEDADCERPQSCLEQAFLDSHALLSVPSQTPRSSPVTEDLTSEAMIESLEQILGDMGDGGIEGLEVEETELWDWENTLVRMSKEREDASRELSDSLADDIFSYVEEALRRESGGCSAQGSDVTTFSEPQQWRPATDPDSNWSGFGEAAPLGNGCGGWTGLKGASEAVSHRTPCTLTPTQFHNSHQGHTSALWPPSSSSSSSSGSSGSNHHCGNAMMSTQSCVTHQRWLPPTQSDRSGPGPTGRSAQHSLNHSGAQQAGAGPQPRGPSVWQQQQQQQEQQRFHHRTLSHSSRTNPAAPPPPGSCMYEKREGRIPSAGGLNGPHAGATAGGPPLRPVPSRPGAAAAGAPRGTAPGPGGGPGGGDVDTLQTSFFCWNGDAQIPRVPLNGVVDPFVFPQLPSGSINLSRNMAP